jgi:hypothetical protein
VTATREDRDGGTLTALAASTSTINIEVIEASSEGFILGYTLTSIELPSSGDLEANERARQIAELTVGLTFEIEVSDFATMEGIRNFDEVAPAIEASVQVVLETVRQDSDPEEFAAFEAAFGQILSAYATEEGVLTSGVPHMSFFLMPFGWDIETAALYEVDNELPNPLGGPAIPALAYIEVNDSDEAEGEIIFTWTQELSGPEAEAALLETMRALIAQLGGDEPTLEDIRGITRQDDGEFVIDTTTWTLLNLSFTQASNIQGRSRTERTGFSLLQ